ncbi:MAG TPA: ribonuclease P protein component [Candidatus Peribacteraceae bacterium]|nr:ribonuclease P protein component [Candidatus Peribacteraceae bacterium]
MKLSHLRGRKINDYLMRKGTVWKGKTMMIRWLRGAPRLRQGSGGQARRLNVDPAKRALYVGTVASTKLHKSAVKRNRMRRRCREALRTLVQNRTDIPTTQLLISPRIASLDSPFELIEADIQTFLSALTSWPNPKARHHASPTI